MACIITIYNEKNVTLLTFSIGSGFGTGSGEGCKIKKKILV